MSARLFSLRIVWILIVLFTAYKSYEVKRWQTLSIIHDDVVNYYAYLPAVFIYHDLTYSFVDSLPEFFQKKIFIPRTKDNRIVQKMTIGESILLLPFFTAAHFNSILNSLPATGYTEEYEFFIALAALFYFALGLFFLRKSLIKYYSEAVTATILLMIALATNLFFYVVYDCGMSHVYCFCLFSIFLWLTIQWYESPSFKFSVFIGLVMGMITLIRPTNCLAFIFFALYGITDRLSLSGKITLFKKNRLQLMIIGISAVLPLLLQMIYWKFASGHWLYYSYGEERFFFSKPHILEGLLGFRKGFFIYTPVMILMIPGIWIAIRQKEKFGLALVLFFIINSYIMFSWWCWWYGGGFGARVMIDSYSLLALPIGTFITKCYKNNWLIKIILMIFISCFILLNLFQSDQAQKNVLRNDGMNAQAYFKIFGKSEVPEDYELMLTPSDAYSAYRGLPERDLFEVDINKLKLMSSYKINIKGSNNKFLCAMVNKNGVIICDRDHAYEWETFLLNRYTGNIATIQSFQGKFVGMDFNRGSKLYATRTSAGRTELFRITDLGDNRFALKAYDGSFITLDTNDSEELVTGAPKITQNETFESISK